MWLTPEPIAMEEQLQGITPMGSAQRYGQVSLGRTTDDSGAVKGRTGATMKTRHTGPSGWYSCDLLCVNLPVAGQGKCGDGGGGGGVLAAGCRLGAPRYSFGEEGLQMALEINAMALEEVECPTRILACMDQR